MRVALAEYQNVCVHVVCVCESLRARTRVCVCVCVCVHVYNLCHNTKHLHCGNQCHNTRNEYNMKICSGKPHHNVSRFMTPKTHVMRHCEDFAVQQHV